MQINKLPRLVIRIVLFIIILVLSINNIQTVEFNLLGIYSLKLPLIILVAIFTGLGIIFGILVNFINNISIKQENKQLKKQLAQLQRAKDFAGTP